MQFPKDKPVRLGKHDMKILRQERYEMDGGKCVDCGAQVFLENGGWWNAHLAHIIGRGAGGPDTIENTRTKCIVCHIGKDHNAGGKPVPAKPKKAEDGSWVN